MQHVSDENSSLDYLIDRIWDELRLVKVYTKKRGAQPDLSDPICLRKGATIEVCSNRLPIPFSIIYIWKDVCNGVHRSLAPNFRYALVW